MDYPGQRQKYLKEYPKYLNDLVLNDQLMSDLKQFCSNFLGTDQKLPEVTIKSYILLELTKTRQSCAQVIKFLKESGDDKNVQIAKELEVLNTSPGRRQYGYETHIDVIPVLPTEVKLPNTIHYPMTKRVRGKAIIINVVPNDVQRESFRFNDIFEQLFFEVEMHFNWTTTRIKHKLETISKEMVQRFKKTEEKDDAIIVMVITHGTDEKIVGKNHPFCGGSDPKDIVPIIDIVDIFAEVEDTTKVFFFTCCREIEETNRNPKYKKCSSKDGKDTNTDTFVYYSCAEGYSTEIDAPMYYTPYGKLLSESIAQYAHNEDMAQIMNRTYQALRELVKGASKDLIGRYAPDNNQKSITHKLYFNPGWYKGKK